MARPDTQPGVDDGEQTPGAAAPPPGDVPPGTGVVRPGTGVVRPGTGVVAPADTAGAKARAAVPEVPERPLEPIHVVLPVIEVKPAKQGFLDRLVAPKPKKEKRDKSDKARTDESELPDESGYPADAVAAAPPTTPPPARPAPPRSEPPPTRIASAPVRPAPAPPAASPPRPPVGWAPEAPPRPGPVRGPGWRRDTRPPARPLDGYGDDWPADASPAGRRLRSGRWLIAAIIVTVLAIGGGLTAGLVRPHGAAPTWRPGPVDAPAGPVLAALGTEAPEPSPAGLAARIQGLLANAALGHVSASVVDVASGDPLFDLAGGGAVIPASTAKLLTAAAVLTARGPDYRIATRAVAGTAPGEVVLVGGGDPTLAASATMSYPGAARLDRLAEQVVATMGGDAPTHIVVDSSLYSGPTLAPTWFAQDAKDGFIAHITALMTDGARQNPRRTAEQSPRYPQPDLAAGQLFARAFGLPASAVSFGTAPADARPLGQVLSPPVSRLVEMMLQQSDNLIAEALARQTALAKGQPASFEGGAAATRQALAELGVPMAGLGLVDGSGLSHANKVSTQLLTSLLAKAAATDAPQLRPILSGLPVAGYSGTLSSRYLRQASGGAAAGTVRAKTGTLSGVNALAGLAVDADGRLLSFAVVANGTTAASQAEAALDRVAAAIAACGCG